MSTGTTASTEPTEAERSEPLVDFDVLSPHCPSRTVLRHVVDRWTPLVVVALQDGALRFGELRQRVGGVTPKVLTQTLRSMERDGLLSRRATGGVPPRVDYELTALGATLARPMEVLRVWAQEHAHEVLNARETYDSAPTATEGADTDAAEAGADRPAGSGW